MRFPAMTMGAGWCLGLADVKALRGRPCGRADGGGVGGGCTDGTFSGRILECA